MAGYQAVFKRVEMKYIMSPAQKQAVMDAIEGKMLLDGYGRTEIRNIYYDTPDFLLARRSIEKPLYKEKLRTRCYGQPEPGGKVFVELKKKYEGVVYKRRLALPIEETEAWLDRRESGPDSQIGKEVDYMFRYYPQLGPRMYLSYEREAYYPADPNTDLRITLDERITARLDDLHLMSKPSGTELIPDGTLMEIKTGTAVPLWLAHVMSENHIFRAPFSKYGNAYKKLLFDRVDWELVD
ncbi:MAG: polyphosphate polymerase domain-containing protein [Methanomethylophilus sp.]|jgi:hypothetical protein